MIEIRPEQMEAFEQVAEHQFHKRLALFLRTEIPDDAGVMSDDELNERIIDAERRAKSYGIRSEASVAQFACLTFYAGPRFNEEPDVHAYLSRPDHMAPEQKLDLLVHELPDDTPTP